MGNPPKSFPSVGGGPRITRITTNREAGGVDVTIRVMREDSWATHQSLFHRWEVAHELHESPRIGRQAAWLFPFVLFVKIRGQPTKVFSIGGRWPTNYTN